MCLYVCLLAEMAHNVMKPMQLKPTQNFILGRKLKYYVRDEISIILKNWLPFWLKISKKKDFIDVLGYTTNKES